MDTTTEASSKVTFQQVVSNVTTALKWKSQALSNNPIDPLHMDESEMFLKMGDCISLFSVEQGGFVSGNGFDDTGCQLQRPFHSKKPLASPNFVNSVFELVPKYKYDAQITLDHELSNLGRERSSIGIFDQGDHEIEQKLIAMKQHEEDERKHNESEFLRVAQKNIVYGQVVQLRHKKSQKFLSVTMKEMSELEKDCLKVTLVENGNEGSWFVITPRLKMRSEGEPVVMGDQVLLFSKRNNMFLHITCTTSKSEINVSPKKCSWRVIPYASYNPNDQILKLGDVVRIYHKEVEGYMTNETVPSQDILIGAKGSASNKDMLFFEIRKSGSKASDIEPPTNSNSLWMLESENTMRGGIATLDKRYRIKHITSGKYLAIHSVSKISDDTNTETIEVFRTEDPNSPKALFEIHLANNHGTREDDICYDDYVRFRHCETKAWLHCNAKTSELDENNVEKASIDASVEFFDTDVYSFHLVPSMETKVLYEVLGEITFLRDYLARFGKAPQYGFYENNSKMAQWLYNDTRKVIQVMEYLIKECNTGNKVNTKMQNLLREQNIVDVVIQLLRSYNGYKNLKNQPEHRILLSLCQTSYSLLKELLNENPINRHYMKRFVPQIQSQIGYSFKATATLTEIYRNNASLLESVDKERIHFFVEQLKRKPVFGYLKFLITICSLNGQSIAKNQDFICKKAIIENADTFIPFKVDEEGKLFVKNFGTSEWSSIESFMEREDTTQTLTFLIGLIELLYNLCLGGNNFAASCISKHLSLKQITRCLKNDQYPSNMRSTLVHLALNLLLADKDFSKPVNFLNYTWLWTDITSDTKTVNKDISSPLLRTFKSNFESENIKTFTIDYLSRVKQAGLGSDENALINSVMHLFKHLFLFGHFNTVENADLYSLLIRLMRDNIYPSECLYRNKLKEKHILVQTYERTSLTADIMDFKINAGHIFKMITDVRCDHRLTKLLSRFKEYMDSMDSTNQRIEMNLDMDSIFETMPFRDEEYIPILKDMILYQHAPIANLGVTLLVRHFSQKKELLDAFKRIQILVDENLVHTYQQVHGFLDGLRHIMTPSVTPDDDQVSQQEVITILEQMTALCQDNTTNHKNHQMIFLNLRAYEVVLSLMKADIGKPSDKILAQSFVFFQKLCLNNKDAQSKLLRYLDFFLEYLDHEDLSIIAAYTVKHLFKDNIINCSQVGETHIRKILQKAHRKKIPIYLDILDTLAVPNQKPLRRNQNLIVKLILEKHQDMVVLYNTTESLERRTKMINSLEFLDPNSELWYHVKLLELFVLGCKGKIYEAEVKCQAMFSLDDILDQIKDVTNWPRIKSVFLDLFEEVYLLTERALKNITLENPVWAMIDIFESDIIGHIANKDLYRDTSDLLNEIESVPFSLEDKVPDDTSSKNSDSDEDRFFNEDKKSESDSDNSDSSDDVFFGENSVDTCDQESETSSQELSDAPVPASPSVLNKVSKKDIYMYLAEREYIFECILPYTVKFFTVYTRPNKLDSTKLDALNRLITTIVALDELDSLSSVHENIFVQCIEDMLHNNILMTSSLKSKVKDILMRSSYRNSLKSTKAQDEEKLNCLKSESEKIDEGLFHFQECCQKSLDLEQDIHAFADLIKSDIETITRDHTITSKLITQIGDMECSAVSSHELEVVITVLKVFRCILEENPDTQSPLNQMGLTHLLLNLITSKHDCIVVEVVQCFIALLDGGNKDVQNTIYDVLKNTQSESFFLKIRNRMRRGMSEIEEKREYNRKRLDVSRPEDLEESPWSASDDMVTLGVTHMKDILRFLQLLCEGHNEDLQNLLRLQSNNLQSYDLVAETALYLEAMERDIDPTNIHLASQVFITLTEFCQGPCHQNQSDLICTRLCESVMYILDESHIECSTIDRIELQQAALTTILSLLEGIGTQSVIPRTMLGSIDLDLIEQNLNHILEVVLSKSNLMDNYVELGFLYFFLLKILNEFDRKGRIARILENISSDNVFTKDIGKIEIVRNHKLERIYFRIPAVCKYLTDSSKEHLIRNVKRTNQQEKIEDFFVIGEKLIQEMEHRETLSKTKHLSWISNYEGVAKNIPFVLSLLINLIIICSYYTDEDNTIRVEPLPLMMLYILAFLHLGFSLMSLLIYAIGHVPLILNSVHMKSTNTWIQNVSTLLSDPYTLYYSTYVVLSILGILQLPNAPYFFAFHLLDIVARSEMLKYVIKSITLNGKALILTAFLAFVVIYIYSIFGFLFYRTKFNEEVPCDNMLMCLVAAINYGMRSGGGIGDVMEAPNWNERDSSFRVMFDYTFFFVVIVLMLNMIQGIIIDTFGELRSQNNEIEEDIQNKCFICGIERVTFDRYGNGFDHHIEKDHSIFHYLYFCMYLKRKERTEYTGPEQYVADKIEEHDWSFVPNLRAIVLDPQELEGMEKEDDGSDGTHRTGDPFGDRIRVLNNRLYQMESQYQDDHIKQMYENKHYAESFRQSLHMYEERMDVLEQKLNQVIIILSNMQNQSDPSLKASKYEQLTGSGRPQLKSTHRSSLGHSLVKSRDSKDSDENM